MFDVSGNRSDVLSRMQVERIGLFRRKKEGRSKEELSNQTRSLRPEGDRKLFN
jgi:hypothetical protein